MRLQKTLNQLAENANANAKVEIINFTESFVFFTLNTKGFIEYNVYEINNISDNLVLEQFCNTTSLKSAFDTYMENITTVLQLNRDEFTSDGDFCDITDTKSALLHRSGTVDEYVTFKVLERQGGEV